MSKQYENQVPEESGPDAQERSGDADARLVAPSGEHNYSEDGVDLTLIRWMRSLTPYERLEVLRRNLAAIQELRGGIQS